MSEPYIGEIVMGGWNFAPRGYAFANGSLLLISQNTALFAVVGTTYGGDGRTTLGLPDLQGRFPMHEGRGPGLTPRQLGQKGGATTATVSEQQMGSHGHTFYATDEDAGEDGPTGGRVAVVRDDEFGSATNATMGSAAVGEAGNNQAHENVHPYQAITFAVALTGVFPPRS